MKPNLCRCGSRRPTPVEGYRMLAAYADNPDVIFYSFLPRRRLLLGYVSRPHRIRQRGRQNFFGTAFRKDIHSRRRRLSRRSNRAALTSSLPPTQQRAEGIKAEFKAYFESRNESIHGFYSKLCMLNTRFELRKYVSQHGDHFVMMGWVPKSDADRLTKLLEGKEGVSVSFTENKNISKLSPPIKLKNSPLPSPL